MRKSVEPANKSGNLKPFDYVLTKDKVLYLVRNHEAREHRILASPQVDFCINSQGKAAENASGGSSRHEKEGDMHILPPNSIEKTYCAKDVLSDLVGKNEPVNEIRTAIKDLVLFLTSKVDLQDLGLTGEQLFRGEAAHCPDIAVVVYGSKAYTSVSSLLRHTLHSSFHFLTPREWVEFYSNCGYLPCPDELKFAGQTARKSDRFLFNGIQVSILAVREENDFTRLDQYKTHAALDMGPKVLEGLVIDSSESMFLPSIYDMKTNQGADFNIYSSNPVFVFQATTGDRIKVSGPAWKIQGRPWIEITPENNGFMETADAGAGRPNLVARNIATSYPFSDGKDMGGTRFAVRKCTDDLYTIFDVQNNRLFELNGTAYLIYSELLKNSDLERIARTLRNASFTVQNEHVSSMIDALRESGLAP